MPKWTSLSLSIWFPISPVHEFIKLAPKTNSNIQLTCIHAGNFCQTALDAIWPSDAIFGVKRSALSSSNLKEEPTINLFKISTAFFFSV